MFSVLNVSLRSRHRGLLRHILLITVAVFVAITLAAALGAAFVVLKFGGGTGRDITIAWNAFASPNVGGYRVHYRLSSGTYPNKVFVGDQTAYT